MCSKNGLLCCCDQSPTAFCLAVLKQSWWMFWRKARKYKQNKERRPGLPQETRVWRDDWMPGGLGVSGCPGVSFLWGRGGVGEVCSQAAAVFRSDKPFSSKVQAHGETRAVCTIQAPFLRNNWASSCFWRLWEFRVGLNNTNLPSFVFFPISQDCESLILFLQ